MRAVNNHVVKNMILIQMMTLMIRVSPRQELEAVILTDQNMLIRAKISKRILKMKCIVHNIINIIVSQKQ